MKKFLIINPFGIGDVLFTTPVVRAIRDNFNDCFIAFWCNQRVQGLFKDNPDINQLFTFSRGDIKKIYQQSVLRGLLCAWRLFSAIKKERFEAVLDFSLDHRYALVSALAGIKKRIGFNYKNRGFFLTHKIDLGGYSNRHVVEYYLGLLKFLNIEAKSKSLQLYLGQKAKARVDSIFRQALISDTDTVVGIAPGAGASWGEDAGRKHWPPLRFAQVADRLCAEFKAKIVLLAAGEEKPISDIVIGAMKNKALDLTGRLSVEELSAAISKLNILLANDGGPLHMASALGIKSVSIFGPVDEQVYGPYPASPGHIVLKKKLSCRPCYSNFRLTLCESEQECIKSISVDEVFEAARTLIMKKERS